MMTKATVNKSRRALHHSSLSCNCTETRTVEEALEACEKSSFDCAIVDYRLPGEDGLQAYFRNDRQTATHRHHHVHRSGR